jgi:hypothetical protein
VVTSKSSQYTTNLQYHKFRITITIQLTTIKLAIIIKTMRTINHNGFIICIGLAQIFAWATSYYLQAVLIEIAPKESN